MFQATRRAAGIALVSAVIVSMTACSKPAPAPAANSAAAKLSGAPYTYYVLHTSLPNSPFSEIPKAAQLGIDEVNNSGGINGRPLQLKTCAVNLDLNKAADCARQAVADKSVIAANVWIGQSEAVLATFSKAGVPIISDYPISLAHYSCEVCFPTSSGAFASVAGEGLLAATKLKAQRVSFVILDVPSTRGLVTVTSQLLKATGQSTQVVKTVPVPLTAGDLSAHVTAASQDVDAILVTLTADFLPRFMRTVQQLGIRVPIVSVPVDRKQIGQIGPSGEGMYHAGVYSHDSAGYKEFETAFTARYPDDPANDLGYSIWLGAHLFQRVSKGLPTVTRQSVLAALGKQTDVDTGGATPQLDFTKRFSGFGGKTPRLFNNTIVYYQVKNGSVVQQSGFEQLFPSS
jgi:branched-chain amino acid transport system substrate-binding protein